MADQPGRLWIISRDLPVRAGYCVDCLGQLYGEPVETISEYLDEAGITSRQAHCGNCGEHKDTFTALLLLHGASAPRLMRYRLP